MDDIRWRDSEMFSQMTFIGFNLTRMRRHYNRMCLCTTCDRSYMVCCRGANNVTRWKTNLNVFCLFASSATLEISARVDFLFFFFFFHFCSALWWVCVNRLRHGKVYLLKEPHTETERKRVIHKRADANHASHTFQFAFINSFWE